MENNNKMLYVMVNFMLVICIIASDVAQNYFSGYNTTALEFPSFRFLLSIITPIVVSILLFVKIFTQKSVPLQFSKIVNTVALIFFVAGIMVCHYFLYMPYTLMQLLEYFPATVLVFCIQLCCLIYDLFFRREPQLIPRRRVY